MKLFASLDTRDRKLLFATLAVTVLVVLAVVLFASNQNDDDDPVPDTYKNGRHGAHAAYDLLQSSGYHVQRWEEPLGLLAQQVDRNSVVILADPQGFGTEDMKSVEEILQRGARVLATGFYGGALLPDTAVLPSQRLGTTCQLASQGLDPLANSGQVWMDTPARWQVDDPRFRVQYDCAGVPAVVEYDQGSGHVVWWSAATPLENGSITRADNLNLFLNAIGPREGHSFYWDESLHGDTRSQWYYARGPAFNLLLVGLCSIAILIVFSFSRRSGPLRDLPQSRRETPVEFLEALGSLYGKAGAASTALSLGYDRFRRQVGNLCGRRGMSMNAAELANALRARFPQTSPEIDEDLSNCEREIGNDRLEPKRALALVQKLDRHSKLLETLASNKKGVQ